MDKIEFTIPICPRTKKNSQQIVYKKMGGKRVPMIIPSKQYKNYEEVCGAFIPKMAIECQVNVKATYYMDTHRKVDLINLHEALHDCLVKHGCLKDDNSRIIVSTDGSRVMYDKDNPRTEVVIECMD